MLPAAGMSCASTRNTERNSAPSRYRTGSSTSSAGDGNATRPGRKASCLRRSIAIAAPPTIREAVTATRSSRTAWGGNHGFLLPKLPCGTLTMSGKRVDSMLRVGIIGCGKIADQHVEHIVHIPGCEIVAVCDADELMARQLQERLGVGTAFTDIGEMLEKAR